MRDHHLLTTTHGLVAFLTSIHTMFGARFRRWQSKVTVVSISKLSKVPLHPSRAPLWARSIQPCVCRCLFPSPNMHDVNHLYMVFKQVIGLWLSLVNSSSFGSSVVLPSENQAEYSNLVFAMVQNIINYVTNYLNISLNWSLTVSEWRFHKNSFIRATKVWQIKYFASDSKT